MPFSELLLAGKAISMTSFFAPAFFVLFLPLSVIGYSITPGKLKKYFLLMASYGFFWLISGELLVYLLLTTFSMHYFGLWLDRIQVKMKSVLNETEKDNRKNIKKTAETCRSHSRQTERKQGCFNGAVILYGVF